MFNDVSTVLVKNRISFSGKERNVFDNNAIPELQCKGVTALCRILNERQFAYLADEVGMGKTYQALGVAAMLLAEKNDARILIIAPNEAVQRNWITEIKNFKSKNLLCDIPMEAFSELRWLTSFLFSNLSRQNP
jgi:superfamily II DNA or RNA helicase